MVSLAPYKNRQDQIYVALLARFQHAAMHNRKFLRAIEAFIKSQAAKGGTARSLAISVKDEAECQVLLCAIIDFIYRKFDNCCTIRLVFTNDR
ncbi:hypothetical protein Plhal304r1_c064g0152181 [Plasmopara halstedii]